MNIGPRLLAVFLSPCVAALSGCPGSVRPTQPTVITIPGPIVYVSIPPPMTVHCPIALPRDASPLEANRIARQRRKALEDCNRRLDSIHAVQGTPTH